MRRFAAILCALSDELFQLEVSMDFDPRWPDDLRARDDRERELSQGSRGGLSNPRERLPLDARDVFTRDLELPRGPERERVWARDSDVTLRGSEVHTLATVGAFRVVPAGDLRDGRDGPLDPHRGDLRHLRDQGLVETIPTSGDDRALVVLTERGRDVLERNRWSSVHRDELGWEALEREFVDRRDVDDERSRPHEPKARQEFYAGVRSGRSTRFTVHRPRELTHDAQVYRAYLKEAERLREDGAFIRRVILDNELKRDYQEFLQERNRGKSDNFDYFASLDDLVLLMDESHRYRASAGVRAINELKPVLGLELTATPFTESARGPVPFKNVVYHYPLARAMDDGFVKEPAVVTRKDFNPAGVSADELERIKLEDGVRLHENVKVELETYARESGRQVVKPFVLVIARDTTHATQLQTLISSDGFFEGRYKDRVLQVDSSRTGAEEDAMVEKLLRIENGDEPTEIVVHVNMLKEGWDVTNLYTIVPLRAANARTLVEQSIGRGLRLPYGEQTGITAVDRLNIVAHDRFQEIVDDANKPDSRSASRPSRSL
jgi:hypothetical protein